MNRLYVAMCAVRHISSAESRYRIEDISLVPKGTNIAIAENVRQALPPFLRTSRPPLQKIVQSFKSISTRKCWSYGITKLLQRSFYDHVIRDEADYLRIWEYIDENPARWNEDIFFELPE